MATRIPRRRNQKACTSCRQVKLRCDNIQTFPGPCSRCERNKSQCRVDPDFKRTRTRNRLEEVTNQLNAIQQTLERQSISSVPERQSATPNPRAAGLRDARLSPVTSITAYGSTESHSSYFYQSSLPVDLPISPICLGQFFLDNGQLIALFDHFKVNYYHHCPILDTEVSLRTLHHNSPILFWTIVIIASRWHPSLFGLYVLLLDSYRGLLGATLISSISSVESLQAVTLLCFWPLAVYKQVEDPSWAYCGLVTNSATKLGLDRPCSDNQGGFSERESWTRRKLWLAIVQANCCLGWSVGVAVAPSILTSLIPPSPLCTNLEKQFVTKVDIFRTFARSCSLVTNLNEFLDSWSFVQNLCIDLEKMRDVHREYWTPETEIIVLGLQLGLYILQLEHGTKHRKGGNKGNAASYRNFIEIGYMTAAQFTHKFAESVKIGNNQQDLSEIPQRYLPKLFYGFLLLAVAFLIKVRFIYAEEVRISYDHISNNIRQIYEIAHAWSREKLDEPGRAVRLIEEFSKAEKKHELELKVSPHDGRAGVRLMDDVISTMKAIRERNERKLQLQNNHSGPGTQHNNELQNTTGFNDSNIFDDMQDTLLDWNVLWGLDLMSMDQDESAIPSSFST